MVPIWVSRNGEEMGAFSLKNIKEGLKTGYFLPVDYGWYKGLNQWFLIEAIVKTLDESPSLSSPPSKEKVALPTRNSPPKKSLVYRLLPSTASSEKPRNLKEEKKRHLPRKVEAWRDDPATPNQIALISRCEAHDDLSRLTKGEAHDIISLLPADGPKVLSEKQKACLAYYGYKDRKLSCLTYDDAMSLLEEVHQNPDGFKVREPWKMAKYRLHPKLYPTRRRRRGCISLFLTAAFIVVVTIWLGQFLQAPPPSGFPAIIKAIALAPPQPSSSASIPTPAAPATPSVFDIAKLTTADIPKTVVCNVAETFSFPEGTFEVPANSEVAVVSLHRNSLTIRFHEATKDVPYTETNLQAEIEEAWKTSSK